MDRRPVALDTDIGSDVDDLLALVLLAGAPDVDLRAVTTVYGDTVLRAQLARHALRLLGQPDVVVAAGRSETRSGKPVWWAGHEGGGIAGLAGVEVDAGLDAVQVLVDAAHDAPGELVVCAVGPLTNVAAACDADPRWAEQVHQLIIMGGDFAGGPAEHNFASDAEAARVVFSSGVPITVVGLDVTTQVWFDEADLAAVAPADDGIGTLIAEQVHDWWAFKGERGNHPHDPLAALTLIEPELFSYEPRPVTVSVEGRDAGAVDRGSADQPLARVATAVAADAAHDVLVSRLAQAVR